MGKWRVDIPVFLEVGYAGDQLSLELVLPDLLVEQLGLQLRRLEGDLAPSLAHLLLEL